MNELWNKIDKKYLLSLPYPADIKEQKYLTDIFDEKEILLTLQMFIEQNQVGKIFSLEQVFR